MWNVLGCANFFVQMSPESVAALPEPYRAAIAARPAWIQAAFAIAVFGGALGCLLLLLRKSAAYYFFIASLLAAILTIGQFHAAAGFSPVSAAAGSVMQLAMSVFLIWYSSWSRARGWLS